MDSHVAMQRSRVAVAHRKRDSEAIRTATRDLAAAKLSDYVARVTAEAPPLTNDQCERIAALLRGGANGAA